MATLLTKKEAAERLKVSEATIERWEKAGVLPAMDLHNGRRQRRMLRFRESDLEEFIARGHTKKKQPPVKRASRRRLREPKQYV